MKLSEAIRLGAMLKPQGFEGTGYRSAPETCAYGASLDAVGSDRTVTDEWPWLETLRGVVCPACHLVEPWGPNGLTHFGIVPHLNNDHRWSREQIADWVETIERRADAASVGTQDDSVPTAVSVEKEKAF